MTMHADAEELDRRINALLGGKAEEYLGELASLTAIASDLRHLANPEFKSRLKANLMDGEPASRPDSLENYYGREIAAAFVPLLGSKPMGMFPADHRSFLVSFVSHVALIALIASGIFVARRPTVKSGPSLISELTYPIAGHGGGGSGDHSAVHATRGTPPKFSDQQLTPAVIVVHNNDPKLSVPASILAPPDIKLPQSNHIGDLISSNLVMPSNGTGTGGGAGDGSGTGLGPGQGLGYGPGFDRGVGGGPFRSGVTAPRATYDPEPEYSEEARKIKLQGVVVLSLVIDPQGQPRTVRVARSLGMGLDEKAIEAVKKWRFTPGTKDGMPVAMQVNVEVNFRLY